MTTYPEHDRLRAVSDESQAIGEFLEWAQSQGWWLCEVDDQSWSVGRYMPISGQIQDWLAKYFEIDLNKIEQEKRAMLDSLRLNQTD